MEYWQRYTIKINLPKLILLTNLNTTLVAHLTSKGGICYLDWEELNTYRNREGILATVNHFYDILCTKTNGYESLLNALNYTNQEGPAQILETARETQRLFEICKQPGSITPHRTEISNMSGFKSTTEKREKDDSSGLKPLLPNDKISCLEKFEKWESNIVQVNLPQLVEFTKVNTLLLAHLFADDVLTELEFKELTACRSTEGNISAGKLLYATILTKKSWFERLLNALKVTSQSGSAYILETARDKQRLFEISKQHGLSTPNESAITEISSKSAFKTKTEKRETGDSSLSRPLLPDVTVSSQEIIQKWQKIAIKTMLPKLLQLTIVNKEIMSQLIVNGVLAEFEMEELWFCRYQEGEITAAKLLYDTIITRRSGYESLVNALQITNQFKPVQILETARNQSLIQNNEQPGSVTPHESATTEKLSEPICKSTTEKRETYDSYGFRPLLPDHNERTVKKIKKWESNIVKMHLSQLVELTIVNTLFLAHLFADDVLSELEWERLSVCRFREETHFVAKQLYGILVTKTNWFESLLNALNRTSQSGAAYILETALEKQRLFEIRKQPGPRTPHDRVSTELSSNQAFKLTLEKRKTDELSASRPMLPDFIVKFLEVIQDWKKSHKK